LIALDEIGGRARPLVGKEVVREQNCEGIIAHSALGAEDSMAQAQLLWLAHKDAFDALRQEVTHHIGLFDLAFGPQRGLQLLIAVEVILDRPLVAPGHKDQRVDAGRNGLLGRILDERLVHDRQQFLRHSLGRRQETCTETGNGKYGFANAFHEGPF
jgi:hypothetical protein